MVSKHFVDALAGSSSSVLANAIVYPLDVVTTRVQMRERPAEKKQTKWQLISKIIKERGLAGLYAGMDVSLLQTFWSNFGYFYFYSWIKRLYSRYSKTTNIAIELFQGALAGAISRAFTTPISVVTTRLQASDKSEDYRSVVQSILKEDGVAGFWRGFQASLILTINPSITYGVFEWIKKLPMFPAQTTPFQSFLVGAFTKSLATVITYPYILAKTRLQGGKGRLGALECLVKEFKTNGPGGLYSGLNEQLSKAVLSQALLFALKDYITQAFTYIPATPDAEAEKV
ncbi:ADP/ATP carrier protein [Kappamyces sp. JEL0680]|nr:ADP/ATP carrier protein [Kappamyces sp. JEL0680]